MNVASILRGKGSDIITANTDDEVSVICKILSEHKIGAILVMDQEKKLAGVISERDIVRALSESGNSCLICKAKDLMTSKVISCSPTDTIDEVMSLMTEKRIRHLPVIDDGNLTGFISIGDVVKSRMDQVEREAEAMRDYIATG